MAGDDESSRGRIGTDDKTFVIELSEPYYPLLTELGVTRPFA